MIINILKSVFKNLQTFLILWGIIIIANQIFIFGACFKSYCLIAALPHTGFIAGLIVHFMNKEELDLIQDTKNYEKPIIQEKDNFIVNKIDENKHIENKREPFCPKCGFKMVLRTARQGKYKGTDFWGCSQFPKCTSIINI